MADLLEITFAARDRLRGDQYFTGITVIADAENDVVGQAERALAQSGLYVLVYLPSATVSSGSTPGPDFQIKIRVDVWENVPVNRHPDRGESGLHCLTVAQHVMCLLHHHVPAGYPSAFTASRNALERVELRDNPNILIYSCNFDFSEAIQYTPQPV